MNPIETVITVEDVVTAMLNGMAVDGITLGADVPPGAKLMDIEDAENLFYIRYGESI